MENEEEKQDELLFEDDMPSIDDDIDIEITDEEEDLDEPDDEEEDDPKEEEEDDDSDSDDDDDLEDEDDSDDGIALQEAELRASNAETHINALNQNAVKNAIDKATWQINFADEREKNINSEIKNQNRALIEAEDEGDTAKKVDAQSKIDDAKQSLTELRAANASLKSQRDGLEKGTVRPEGYTEPRKPDVSEARRKQDELDPVGKEWAKRNPWILNPTTVGESKKRFYALQIDKQMNKSSKTKNKVGTRAYYNELDRRVKKKMSDDAVKGGRKRSNISGAPKGEGRKAKSKNSVKITPNDVSMMKTIGLDVHDPEVVREFALNKRDTERDEGGKIREKNPVRATRKVAK